MITTIQRSPAWGHRWRRFAAPLILAFAGFAQAQTLDNAAAPGAWAFTVSPYLWAAGIKGQAATLPNLPPSEVNESFSDIWDDLKFAGMIVGRARNGRFAIAGDLQYVETTADGETPGPLYGDTELTSKSFLLSALGEYIIAEQGNSSFGVLGGARFWSVDTRLELDSGLLPGRSISDSETWLDPMIGVRGNLDLNDRWFLTGWGFLGGFGVGSDLMADVFGGLGYRFSRPGLSTVIGYRWMKVDYEDGDFLYDVEQQGIMAGMIFRF